MIAKCPKPPKDSEKKASLTNLRKKIIVRVTTAMMTMTLKYTHLWHECLMTTNAKIKTMVIVHN